MPENESEIELWPNNVLCSYMLLQPCNTHNPIGANFVVTDKLLIPVIFSAGCLFSDFFRCLGLPIFSVGLFIVSSSSIEKLSKFDEFKISINCTKPKKLSTKILIKIVRRCSCLYCNSFFCVLNCFGCWWFCLCFVGIELVVFLLNAANILSIDYFAKSLFFICVSWMIEIFRPRPQNGGEKKKKRNKIHEEYIINWLYEAPGPN